MTRDSGVRVFVDTNVLVYLRDSRNADKQRAAAEWLALLWETRAGRISTQVLQEYYVAVTAKLDPGLTAAEAREDIAALRAWRPAEITLALLEEAWDAQDRWGFSFWDSLIVAAATAQGCTLLLTEDLSHGQELHRLRVISPFEADPEPVLA